MEHNKLTGIPPINGKYTWSNKRVGNRNINEVGSYIGPRKYCINFNSTRSKILHTTASDHKPVAIILGKMDNQGPLPFKYSPIWDKRKDFRNLISDTWAQKNHRITSLCVGNKIKKFEN